MYFTEIYSHRSSPVMRCVFQLASDCEVLHPTKDSDVDVYMRCNEVPSTLGEVEVGNNLAQH
jgi:hypothetical protein